MNLRENTRYNHEVACIAKLPFPWERLRNKSILVSGANGMIGSFLIDVIMNCNETQGLNCKIYALVRSKEKALKRFHYDWQSNIVHFIHHDINNPLLMESIKTIDFVLHLASNTHPTAYSTDPIGTVTTNVIGTNNLLKFAVGHDAKRFVFASSNEIYGENRGDAEFFDETYCGYIDSNTMRAGYPESKRCGEALCQAYKKQNHLDVVISRFTRSYGPTMLMTDTKAISQFIKNGVEGKNIILKSLGTQYYSYTYVADAVAGLLTVLFSGESGEAYNIVGQKSDIMLKDLAGRIAEAAGTKVVFELPDDVEKCGYSVVTKARMNGNKLRKLGFEAQYDIGRGIDSTLTILKSIY